MAQDSPEVKAAKFLDTLYVLSASGQEDQAIDEVVDFFDDAMSNKDIDLCDTVLRLADTNSFPPSVSFAIFAMAFAEASKFPNRDAFLSRLFATIAETRSQKIAAALLAGL